MKALNFSKFLISLIAGKVIGIFSQREHHIKRGYRHRKSYNYDDDRTYRDEYQKEVYELAKANLLKNQYTKVVDLGCGSGYKLIKYFSDYETVGIDVSPTYEHLKNTYPNRNWINSDQATAMPEETDILICADVIEHVLEPDKLLETIKKIKFKCLYLSTPERDMLHGIQHYGPPLNPAHVREWNANEFYNFVSQYFKITSHQITHVGHRTQLLICVPYQTKS